MSVADQIQASDEESDRVKRLQTEVARLRAAEFPLVARAEFLAMEKRAEAAEAETEQVRQSAHEMAADLRAAEAEIGRLRQSASDIADLTSSTFGYMRERKKAEVARLRAALELVRDACRAYGGGEVGGYADFIHVCSEALEAK